MADYRWIITEDYTDTYFGTNGPDVGIEGPRDADDHVRLDHRWRCFDDDANLCYEGLIGGDYSGFEPLDDFCEPNAGCTSIWYLNNGVWEEL